MQVLEFLLHLAVNYAHEDAVSSQAHESIGDDTFFQISTQVQATFPFHFSDPILASGCQKMQPPVTHRNVHKCRQAGRTASKQRRDLQCRAEAKKYHQSGLWALFSECLKVTYFLVICAHIHTLLPVGF